MQNIENKIVATFKNYDKIVLLNDGFLYQLPHCPAKRTKVFKKLTYNEKRKAYYINGQLVTKQKLIKMKKLLLILLLTGCSHDDTIERNPCECNTVTDAVTHQSNENGVIIYTTIMMTFNECMGTYEQMHHITTNSNEIPTLNQCYYGQ